MTEQEKELNFLSWFYCEADFGPADGDVRYYMKERYKKEFPNAVPDGYFEEEDEE